MIELLKAIVILMEIITSIYGNRLIEGVTYDYHVSFKMVRDKPLLISNKLTVNQYSGNRKSIVKAVPLIR